MTVAEFRHWEPPEHAERRWPLLDGVPVCMAPTSIDHGLIVSETAALLTHHLRDRRPACRVVTARGVIPRVRAATNERIPDLGVTRAAHPGTRMISDPVLLIDILSPSNEAATRANVWAYATLPSVLEILILHSTRMEAELLRRDAAGTWPEQPTMLESADTLHPESIGFSAPMAAFYRAAVMT